LISIFFGFILGYNRRWDRTQSDKAGDKGIIMQGVDVEDKMVIIGMRDNRASPFGDAPFLDNLLCTYMASGSEAVMLNIDCT